MQHLTRKIKIWHIMLATAVLAGLFARFGVARATGMVLAIDVTLLPIVLARRGGRVRAAAWVCTLYPLIALGSVCAIWLTAWCTLGHPPRTVLGDPDLITSIVQTLFQLSKALLLGLPVAFVIVGPLVLIHDVQSFRSEGLHPNRTIARLLIPSIVWLTAMGILSMFGITEIFHWCLD